MIINLEQLQELSYAADDVIGYLTDTSCSDPDCCGGPYYTDEQYNEGCDVLRKYGIEVDA